MKKAVLWLKLSLVVALALAVTIAVGCAKKEPVAEKPEPEAVVEQPAASEKSVEKAPEIKEVQASGEIGLSIGDTAPDFELPLLDGGTQRLSDLRGTPVFVNFMTTWCPPCQKELPAVQQIHDDYGNEIVVLVVSSGEPLSDVSDYFVTGDYTFKILFDTEDALYADYAIDFIPQSYFINADGVIVEYLSGGSTYETFKRSVMKAL